MKYNHFIFIVFCFVTCNCFAQSDSTRVVVFENGFWKKGYIEYSEDSTEVKIETKDGKTLTYPSEDVERIMSIDQFLHYKKERRGEFDSTLEKRKKSKLHFNVETGISYSIGGEISALRNQNGGIVTQFSGANMVNSVVRLTVGGLFWNRRCFMGGGIGYLKYSYTDVGDDVPFLEDLYYPLFYNARLYFGKQKLRGYLSTILGIENVNAFRSSVPSNNSFLFESSTGVSYWINDGHLHIDLGLSFSRTTIYPHSETGGNFEKYINRFNLIGVRASLGF